MRMHYPWLRAPLAAVLILGLSGSARSEEQASVLGRWLHRTTSDGSNRSMPGGPTPRGTTWPSRLWEAISPRRSMARLTRQTKAMWKRIVPGDRMAQKQPIRRTRGRRGGSSGPWWSLSRLFGGRQEPTPPKTVQEWIAQERINP